jgi:hypothetical protein
MPELLRDAVQRATGKMPEDHDFAYLKDNLAGIVRATLEQFSGRDLRSGKPIAVSAAKHIAGTMAPLYKFGNDAWEFYFQEGNWDAAVYEAAQQALQNSGQHILPASDALVKAFRGPAAPQSGFRLQDLGTKVYESKPDTYKASKALDRAKARESGERAYEKKY